MKRIIRNIKNIVGLFIPVRFQDSSNERYYWSFTLAIADIPLGWVMIAIALIF